MKEGNFSEFSLIDKIKSVFSELVKGNDVIGIGDDCAVIPQISGKDTLVSTDLLVEGVHFILPDVQAATSDISTVNEPDSSHTGGSINKEAHSSRISGISAYELGWKSAAVNISDIAGMGGRPTATFLSIAIPARVRSMKIRKFNPTVICSGEENINDLQIVRCESGSSNVQSVANTSNDSNMLVSWLDEFLRGYKDISVKYGVALLGGDTTSSQDKLCINVTVLGECHHGKAVRRSAAQAGDLICVTGNLGDSATGLKLLLCKNELCARTETIQRTNVKVNPFHTSDCKERLLHKHYMPDPRVKEGIALAKVQGIGAMMDISDGIASDLEHILDESNQSCATCDSQLNVNKCSEGRQLAAVVDINKLPMSDYMKQACAENGWDPVELAVGGGEDYELLFTCRPDAQIPVEHYVIGQIIGRPSTVNPESGDKDSSVNPGSNIIWKGTDRDFSGYNHF